MPNVSICRFCLKEFTPKPRTAGTYCSHACRNAALSRMKAQARAAWPVHDCPVCWKSFQRPAWKDSNQFCSAKCWYAHLRASPEAGKRWKPPSQVCDGCGKVFKAQRYEGRQFCSRRCYLEANVGEGHPGFKTGRRIDAYGYIEVTVAPGKRRKEHRIVMERVLGRPLRTDEAVDHINGDRRDNKPENLRVMTRSDHAKMHMAPWKKSKRPPKQRPGNAENLGTDGRFHAHPIGSEYVSSIGYVMVKTESGWKLKHRLVAAQVMGRPLAKKEVVHHLDGNPLNNDPTNLLVLPSQGAHNLITIPHRNSPVTKPRKP